MTVAHVSLYYLAVVKYIGGHFGGPKALSEVVKDSQRGLKRQEWNPAPKETQNGRKVAVPTVQQCANFVLHCLLYKTPCTYSYNFH